MLETLINEKLIQLNVKAKDWEDAIRKSAKLLLMEGKISEKYIESMIKSNQQNGPYFVIAKHIALPHASFKSGAKEQAIGITTLLNPVISGQTANDPVKYLFCLSATDQSSHLTALSDLVVLLEDKTFFRMLDNAKCPNEVMAYIKNKAFD